MKSAGARQAAQVLVFFALVLPIVLLPVAAYAVDAAVSAAAYARLVEITARAAEEAGQQIDAARLRSGGGVALDVPAAIATARQVVAEAEPAARLALVEVAGSEVRVETTLVVILPLNFLGSPAVTLHAGASARIATGYDSPSSRLPLPTSTF